MSELAEQCKFFSKFQGPYDRSYLAWFYFALKTFFIVDKKDKVQKVKSIPSLIFHPQSESDPYRLDAKQLHNMLINSQNLFLTDLFGIHVLVEVYANLLEEVIRSATLQSDLKAVEACLRIVAQVVALPSGYIVSENTMKNDKVGGQPRLSQTLDKYMTLKKLVVKLLDSPLKDFKHTTHGACMYMWISVLNALQNESLAELLDYAKELLLHPFAGKFDTDLLDKSKCVVFYTILDIIETIIMALETRTETANCMRILMEQMIGIVEEKVPADKPAYKRLEAKRTNDYEKVLCALIRLCLYAANVIAGQGNVRLKIMIKSVGDAHIRAQGHHDEVRQGDGEREDSSRFRLRNGQEGRRNRHRLPHLDQQLPESHQLHAKRVHRFLQQVPGGEQQLGVQAVKSENPRAGRRPTGQHRRIGTQERPLRHPYRGPRL